MTAYGQVYMEGMKMTKMTSAYANKMIRKLNEDKEFWRAKENEGYLYVAALDEEPVIPDYDYAEASARIAEIDEKIARIKHAINLANCSNTVEEGGEKMTIDTVLVKMSQLNRRKEMLDNMRKHQPKVRLNTSLYSQRKTAPEYQYINYDLEQVQKDYDVIDARIASLQLVLDKYNQTVEFDVDV